MPRHFTLVNEFIISAEQFMLISYAGKFNLHDIINAIDFATFKVYLQ